MAFAQPTSYTEEDYYNLPENVRAELIGGQFYYMAAPSRMHQEILSALHAAIYNYIKSNGGSCKVYPAPFAVKISKEKDTIVEPDISVICAPDKLTDRGCTGAPDWIIEIISPGNPGHDYIRKLNLYMNSGVREYWIVNPMKSTVNVYDFEHEKGTDQYVFKDTIPVCIYENLNINIAYLLS
ncbi:MAG: Uma2 family endonuclease [Lachnospiraceae bacterium]|jgi:Uma2 family endonuclease|nr:Uma2 family endonuclease [Lachnospiraceae bacterium]